jgi:hypothetical protein
MAYGGGEYRPFRRGIVALVALSAAFALPALAPPPAGARAKPDLQITEARLARGQYAFKGERLNSTVDFTVKNLGGGRAGPSRVSVVLKHGNRLFRLRVSTTGPLNPGRSENTGLGIDARNDFPAGQYQIGVCADVGGKVAESREGNNCTTAKRMFYSTYRTWAGTFGALYTRGGIFGSDLAWATLSATKFGPGRYLGRGFFRWKSNGAGSIKYRDSGSGAGCSYSGTGTFAIDARFSYVQVVYRHDAFYSAAAGTIPGSKFSVVENCNGTMKNYDVPVGGTAALVVGRKDLPFGSESLKGSEIFPAIPEIKYTWDLAGR